MCGRFANTENIDVQAAQFDADPRDTHWTPSANCAPHQQLPIIFEYNEHRYLRLAEWGFQASWAPGKALINAQSETAAEKSSFKDAFRKRRCVIPANAFYEWKKVSSGKQPMVFQCRNQALFPMAGIWEQTQTDQGRIGRFTILTCSANQQLADIHARMPVILQADEINTWLSNNSSLDRIQDLCRSYNDNETDIREMDRSINNVRNNSPELLQDYLL